MRILEATLVSNRKVTILEFCLDCFVFLRLFLPNKSLLDFNIYLGARTVTKIVMKYTAQELLGLMLLLLSCWQHCLSYVIVRPMFPIFCPKLPSHSMVGNVLYAKKKDTLEVDSSAATSSSPVAAVTMQMKPEFSRIIHLAQIPKSRPAVCKLIAKKNERDELTKRFDCGRMSRLAANVTLTREPPNSIIVSGTINVRFDFGFEQFEDSSKSFETNILNNFDGTGEYLKFEDATDFDDEVQPNANIDVGAIVSQYLSLMFEL